MGTTITAAAGVSGIVWQRNREKRVELERAHRAEMLPIYRQLVETLKDIDAFTGKPPEEQKEFFSDLSTNMILHGPASVVSAWNAWNRASDPVTHSTFITWEDLLRAIRDDLGLDSKAVPRGDLLRLWVNEDDDDESRALWAGIRTG